MSNTTALAAVASLKVQGQIDVYNRLADALSRPHYTGKKTAANVQSALSTFLESNSVQLAPDLSDAYDVNGDSILNPTTPTTPTTPTILPPTDIELKTAQADIKAWMRAPMNLTAERIAEVSKETVDELMPAFDNDTITPDNLVELRAALAQLHVLSTPTSATRKRASTPTGKRTAPLSNDTPLYLLCTANPKRPGASQVRFQNTWFPEGNPTATLTVGEAMQRGSTRGDINWDLDHGFITLQPPTA